MLKSADNAAVKRHGSRPLPPNIIMMLIFPQGLWAYKSPNYGKPVKRYKPVKKFCLWLGMFARQLFIIQAYGH